MGAGRCDWCELSARIDMTEAHLLAQCSRLSLLHIKTGNKTEQKYANYVCAELNAQLFGHRWAATYVVLFCFVLFVF